MTSSQVWRRLPDDASIPHQMTLKSFLLVGTIGAVMRLGYYTLVE